jgi:hypothetical protein
MEHTTYLAGLLADVEALRRSILEDSMAFARRKKQLESLTADQACIRASCNQIEADCAEIMVALGIRGAPGADDEERLA